ncbi:succinyl-diaminopimelate desuccinylase [Pseudoclavibacter chungangensis]|uniref:Succinyl-diaminopimelate desuccinylase n=1 Tax=Pseudoclavibacter chungangensis TaxID=587635 RepID=A0A7J5BMF6_9MICO|nr:succinyl-diaminopimelate desuccinylase [Pseudoclavibacter chungangensis]KAB1652509.1 succinyl-diaminopimelate desuccinylase [Pseudoclavibacter chungangensis]NYJ66099.1 succinyl-diaminopimelate desuccinylase [Pseudoclavibacter chungangensis]
MSADVTPPADRQQHPAGLDPSVSAVELTRALCDIPSVSGSESVLADAVEAALDEAPHLRVTRFGNTVVARTELGRAQRVAIAGHLDTVPINDNLPTRLVEVSPDEAAADVEGTEPGAYLWGRGTVDMKAGVAVQLKLAIELTEPVVDVTWLWYDNEEVSAELNGLGHLADARPELLRADFAILGEPTRGLVEGGCNGSMRIDVRTHGRRAHSARAWTGSNAIHAAAPILARLAAYEPATVHVDGLDYREGLNAVRISGGVAGNVIPDECVVHVNYRFAPSTSVEDAEAWLRTFFDGFEVEVVDRSPGARPGLDAPVAAAFVAAVDAEPRPKYGWTDVARFSALGVPAVNYGPGDPQKAHADDERVPLAQIDRVEQGLRRYLTGLS